MSLALAALAVGTGVEVLLAWRPTKYVRATALCVFVAGLLLALWCIYLPWVSIVYAAGCVVLCILSFHPIKILPALLTVGAALVLLLVPGAQELLYLDCRYAGQFTYVAEGVCYSPEWDCNVAVDLELGDDYQSILYTRRAAAECAAALPLKAQIVYAYLERQQTPYLASSFEDYVRVMNPTLHLGVKLPTGTGAANWVYDFPIQCVLEPI